jgi:hypothetical protein
MRSNLARIDKLARRSDRDDTPREAEPDPWVQGLMRYAAGDLEVLRTMPSDEFWRLVGRTADGRAFIAFLDRCSTPDWHRLRESLNLPTGKRRPGERTLHFYKRVLRESENENATE